MEKKSTSFTELTITIKMKMVPLTVWLWQGRSQTKANQDPELSHGDQAETGAKEEGCCPSSHQAAERGLGSGTSRVDPDIQMQMQQQRR